MELDDELCLCFHVSRRKVENYLRIHQPSRAAQLSECQGAGTGCGWCRPFLKKLFERAQAESSEMPEDLPGAAEYADQRNFYRRKQDA